MSSEEYWENSGEIETVTGEYFRIAAPSFDIQAIAHGAANKCRFNGQCLFYYPVASHAVMVSRIMQGSQLGDPFEGLMHDGNESYLPDTPSPYKAGLPDLVRLETRVDTKLRAAFGLPLHKTNECKWADCVALMIEAHYLLPSRGLGPEWARMQKFHAPAQALIRQGFRIPQYDVPPARARAQFIERFNELWSARH